MGRKLALLIGNGRYDDPGLARLPTADVDVREIADVLRLPEVGEFDEVVELANEGLARVRRSITEFFSRAKRDDLLVFYFSGHGVKDQDGRLYLAVRDTELPLLVGTSIEAAFITAQMDRSYSKRQVLILDCCHSGAFSYGAKAGQAQSVGIGPAFEGTGYGHVVLTATDSTQYAWEGDRIIGDSDKSVFTHYLLQGLKTGEADRDRDGLITIDEVYEYVFEHVVRETPKQTPGKWSYKQQGDIIIARNPHLAKPAPLPLELQALLDSPLARLRVEAVPELASLAQGAHRGLALAARAALEGLRADDSRRVSAAAEEVLATLSPPPPAAAVSIAAPAESPPRTVPEQQPSQSERQAIERARSQALTAVQERVEDLLQREELEEASRVLGQAEKDFDAAASFAWLKSEVERIRLAKKAEADRLANELVRDSGQGVVRAEPDPIVRDEPGTVVRDEPGTTAAKKARPWFLSLTFQLRVAFMIVAATTGTVMYGLWSRGSLPVDESPSTVVKPPDATEGPKTGGPPLPKPVDPAPTPPPVNPTPDGQQQISKPPPKPVEKPQPKPPVAGPSTTPPAPAPSSADLQIKQLLALGESSLQAQQYDTAIDSFENAARLGSKVGQTRANDARQMKAQQQRDADLKAQQAKEAELKAQQARDALQARQDAQQARQRLELAQAFMDKGDYDQSLRLIQEAMKLDPKNAEAASLQKKVVAARDFERKLP